MIIFIGFLIPVMLFYNLISTLSSWQSHEWSLWRLGVQLNMTQPVSHALRRLRRITNDELFIKVPVK